VATWLHDLDDMLGRYPHIISAVETLATLAAVVVSLGLSYVAHRANKTRLTARLFLTVILEDGVPPDQRPEYLTVSITNAGMMPLSIPFAFFFWRLPFRPWGRIEPTFTRSRDPHRQP
jgi:hypothetical protein